MTDSNVVLFPAKDEIYTMEVKKYAGPGNLWSVRIIDSGHLPAPKIFEVCMNTSFILRRMGQNYTQTPDFGGGDDAPPVGRGLLSAMAVMCLFSIPIFALAAYGAWSLLP